MESWAALRITSRHAQRDEPTRCYGVYALDMDHQRVETLAARAVVLATGSGHLVQGNTIGLSATGAALQDMLNVLGSDYITAARSLGLSDREIIRQDALKNVMVQLLTVSGIVLGYLLAGNVLVETIFAWPGLGFYAWNALTGSDYDAIQGFVLIVAVIYVFLNFFVDLAYTLIDPRIRLA